MRVNNWLSGFACVLLLGVVGCKKDKIREGIPVVVEKVGVDDVEIFGDYVGRIRARQFVEVHARVEGYLEKMLFEEGKRVISPCLLSIPIYIKRGPIKLRLN